MTIGYFAYRGWAFRLLDMLLEKKDPELKFVIRTVPYREEKIDYGRYPGLEIFDPKDKMAVPRIVEEEKLDIALFYGWSWIVPEDVTKKIDCLCLHPSLLPKYRGGCPLQHQIINGEAKGGLTIFRMNEVLDGGDILAQRKFSLDGTLAEVFDRVTEQGAAATLKLLQDYKKNKVKYIPQKNLDKFPAYPRRKPAESEVKFIDLQNMSTKYFYNFVRALNNPYPNCFIFLPDSKKLTIQEVKITKTKPRGEFLQLKDGFAKLVRYRIE